jgi:hypothetical protein
MHPRLAALAKTARESEFWNIADQTPFHQPVRRLWNSCKEMG